MHGGTSPQRARGRNLEEVGAGRGGVAFVGGGWAAPKLLSGRGNSHHASGSLNTPCQTLSAAARVLDRRAIELRDRIHGGSRMKFTITFAVAPSKASSSWSTSTSVTPEAFRASLRSVRAGSSAVNAMLYQRHCHRSTCRFGKRRSHRIRCVRNISRFTLRVCFSTLQAVGCTWEYDWEYDWEYGWQYGWQYDWEYGRKHGSFERSHTAKVRATLFCSPTCSPFLTL